MFAKVCILICVSFSSLVFAAAPPKPVLATALLNHNRQYSFTELTVSNSAEGNAFWYTGKNDFYKRVSFYDLVEISRKDGHVFLTLIRTGTQPVKEIDDLQFHGKTVAGKTVVFRLREVVSIRFVTAKCDKICPLGHVWPNTDYLYCPYDGMELEIMKKKELKFDSSKDKKTRQEAGQN